MVRNRFPHGFIYYDFWFRVPAIEVVETHTCTHYTASIPTYMYTYIYIAVTPRGLYIAQTIGELFKTQLIYVIYLQPK